MDPKKQKTGKHYCTYRTRYVLIFLVHSVHTPHDSEICERVHDTVDLTLYDSEAYDFIERLICTGVQQVATGVYRLRSDKLTT